MTAATEAILSSFILETEWEDLSAGVQEWALMCFMDNLSATVSGSTARSTTIAESMALDLMPGDQATLFAGGRKASALGAAFANGVAANAFDIDDCGQYTRGHPGAQVLPAALAVGEKTGASGRQVLAASVVGYEVMFRAGRCLHHRDRSYRGCGAWGSVGCAAIAATMLDLTPPQVVSALGIAEYDSPAAPILTAVEYPAMVKHATGYGAMNGLMSAELAARGFTGTPTMLLDDEYEHWVRDLGRDYVLPHGMSWKEYACCMWAHAPLLAVDKLRSEHEFSAPDVRRVVVTIYPDALQLHVLHPDTTEEAQFSIAWPVAALIVDGEVATQQVADERLGDTRIHELVDRIEFESSDEMAQRYLGSDDGEADSMDAASVRIELADGRVLDSGLVEHIVYEREAPLWTRARMERKTRWLLRHLFTVEALDRLIDAVWSLDHVDDVRDFVALVGRLRAMSSGESAARETS